MEERPGHIFQSEDSTLTDLEFHRQIHESTDISLYTEFSYQQESILNYMLLLQNILSGFLMAFSAVLLIVSLIIVSHSLSAVIEQEKQDMVILKTMEMSSRGFRGVYLTLYGGTISLGLILGMIPASRTGSLRI